MKEKFWNIVTNGDVGSLYIYGEIVGEKWFEEDVTPLDFKRALEALGNLSELHIYINSPGGDVFAANAIYNMLQRSPARKIVHIDGLAASAASVIAMVGDEIIMPPGAMMMIHLAWCMAVGNANDLIKQAEVLGRIDSANAEVYAKKTGIGTDEVMKMLENETWLSAQEAVELGFATSVDEETRVAAKLDAQFASRYRNTPKELLETEPCKGGESQPLEENIEPALPEKDTPAEDASAIALVQQREDFNRIKKKIIGE